MTTAVEERSVNVDHEGAITLERLDSATHYNAWLGNRFCKYLGKRVLEIGAGIGTITRQIEKGRELVIALDIEEGYVQKLLATFADKPHVRPVLVDVAKMDFDSLRGERIDSILLSNVLEHIPDDGEAVRTFHRLLEPKGRLVVFVPALPVLFGALDDAVGHYRRYTEQSLRNVIESNGLRITHLEWMNVLGIPGWFINGRIFRRRTVPGLQLKVFDRMLPLIARVESKFRLPIGMSLFVVAEKED